MILSTWHEVIAMTHYSSNIRYGGSIPDNPDMCPRLSGRYRYRSKCYPVDIDRGKMVVVCWISGYPSIRILTLPLPPRALCGSRRPEPTLPFEAVGSAAEPSGGGGMAGPDWGGIRDDPNSPGGLQFKIIIGSARPNRSYTQHISRRLNTTHEPLQTSCQARDQTAPQAQPMCSPTVQTFTQHTCNGSRH